MRRKFWPFLLVLGCAVALGQQPSFQNQQRTSGVIGITPGQTARVHVLYPTAPAPILQPVCSVTLTIANDQGALLKSNTVSQLIPSRSVSLDLNGDTDLGGSPRLEIYGASIAANGCGLVTDVELIDNATQKTILVTGSQQTFPPAPRAAEQPTAAFHR